MLFNDIKLLIIYCKTSIMGTTESRHLYFADTFSIPKSHVFVCFYLLKVDKFYSLELRCLLFRGFIVYYFPAPPSPKFSFSSMPPSAIQCLKYSIQRKVPHLFLIKINDHLNCLLTSHNLQFSSFLV